MKAAVLNSPRQIEITDRPEPVPASDEVLVRVTSVGVCGSDVHYYERGRIGRYVLTQPLVLGHEVAGEVVRRGTNVTELEPGQRVSVEPGVPCRRCGECRAGRYNLCQEIRFFATPPYDGAFCEYITIPADFAHPVPDVMSDDAAALIEPLSVGIWATRKARVHPGDRVLVTGAGPIGILAAQAARACGAADVAITDINPGRLAYAAALGITPINTSQAAGPPTDNQPSVILECSGSESALTGAIGAMQPSGRIVLVGMGPDTITLPMSIIQDRELQITGIFRYANTWPAAIALAASNQVQLDALVTHKFSLADAETALVAAQQDPGAIKVIIEPNRPSHAREERAEPVRQPFNA